MNIIIKHLDGTTETVNTGLDVSITGDGEGVRIIAGFEGIHISAKSSTEKRRLAYLQNYNAIVDREDVVTLCGNTAAFSSASTGLASGDGYYISSINSRRGLNTEFAIVGGPTFRWAKGGTANTLGIDDIGRPDVDCADYITLMEYLTVIEQALTALADQITGEPEGELGGSGGTTPLAVTYGTHKQYESLLAMWNYFVYRMAVTFDSTYQSESIFFQGQYINTTDSDVSLTTCELILTCDASPATIKPFRKIKTVSSIGDAPVMDITPLTTVALSGELHWLVSSESAYTLIPRQEIVFTARLDILMDEDMEIPDRMATTTISWPVYIQQSPGSSLELITIVKSNKVYLYAEDIA